MEFMEKNDVWTFEGAATPEVCKAILQSYEEIQDSCKSTTYVSQGRVIDANKVPEAELALSLYLSVIVNPVKTMLRHYGYEKLVQGQTLIAKYNAGEGCALHNDITLSKGQNIASHSALLFLNDDYEGGEFAFPRKEMIFKPKAGTLLLFPVSFTHTHEVKKVLRGSRYAMFSLLMYPVYESPGVEFTI